MEISFFTQTKILRQVQTLVKRYNGYFKYNPLIMQDSAQVALTFEDVMSANKFSIMLRISEMKHF